MTYDNTNSGMLLRNENRENERQPEFKGSLDVEGVQYWISAWVNTGKEGSKIEGKKYFSIKLTAKDAPKESKPVASKSRVGFERDLDDEIPF